MRGKEFDCYEKLEDVKDRKESRLRVLICDGEV